MGPFRNRDDFECRPWIDLVEQHLVVIRGEQIRYLYLHWTVVLLYAVSASGARDRSHRTEDIHHFADSLKLSFAERLKVSVIAAESADVTEGPGQREVDPGPQKPAPDDLAEALAHADLIGTDFVERGERPEEDARADDHGEERPFGETVEPRSGDLETELVVEGRSDVAHDAAGFGEETEQTAFENGPRLLHGPGAVELDDEVDDELESEYGEEPEEDSSRGGVDAVSGQGRMQ